MANPNSSSKWKGFLRHTRKDCVLAIGPTKSSSRRKTKSDCVSRQCRSFTEKYRPTKITLGEGNAGRVFVAVRQVDGQSVAVKRFKQRQAPESEYDYVGKILAEFGVASQLRHSNICQNLELVRDDEGQWYQVMEYAPLDLFDRVCSKRMSQREIDCTFMQLVAGLSYLHQSGIAHRDIKLENVVYTESGVMKIIDFGVATSCNGDNDQQQRLLDGMNSHPRLLCSY
jgi:serine/threonine protein kinase